MKKVNHLRFKFPWPLSFFYIYVQIGPERRKNDNKTESMQIDRREEQTWMKGIFYFFLLSGLMMIFGLVALITLYILKSQLGINLLHHSHPVKDLFLHLGLCPSPDSF